MNEIAETIRDCGVAGAGGAGFPSYAKWNNLDSVERLMVNHHESEPCYYSDKWLGDVYADELGDFIQSELTELFDLVVVGTKEKYREEGWLHRLENASGATVYGPEELPIDVDGKTGVAFACTPDVYTFSEERVLLRVAVGVAVKDSLPTELGWIVQNTETVYNIYRAVRDGIPVTHKFVHVDGRTPRHRCLHVPIGTSATALLKAAGVEGGRVPADYVLADGGPGWCYRIEEHPEEFGVRKRTNAVLVLDEAVVRDNIKEDGQIDVLQEADWGPTAERPHETEPTPLTPDSVRIPLITNAAYTGLVAPSIPTVVPGDVVEVGDVIANPGEGLSIPQHASIDGEISEITDSHIVIERR